MTPVEERKMERFPTIRERRVQFECAVKQSEMEAIHCECRVPYDSTPGDMIQCTMYHMWFHYLCEWLPIQEMVLF